MGDGALAWVSTPIRWIGVLTGCFCIFGVGAGTAVAITNRDELAEMQDLSHNGVAARAVVTSTEQHNGVCYTFLDAGLQPRSGCSFAHYPGEDAATLHVGQTIDIVYDASNPSISCSCVPGAEAASSGAQPFLIGLIAAITSTALSALYLARRGLPRAASVLTRRRWLEDQD